MGVVKVFCFLFLSMFLLLPPAEAQDCFTDKTFNAMASFPTKDGRRAAEAFWIEFKFEDEQFSSVDLCDILQSLEPPCFSGSDCKEAPPEWVTRISRTGISFGAVLICEDNPRCTVRITGMILEDAEKNCKGMQGVIRVDRRCGVLNLSGKSGRYVGQAE